MYKNITRLFHSLSGVRMLVLILLAGLIDSGTRQNWADERQEGTPRYSIEFDVLTQPLPNYRIQAQKWGRVFQQLGLNVKFRDGRPGERTRVENVDRSVGLTALIVGIMEPDGRILVRDQKFSMTAPAPLVDMVEQVRVYGAAGPPDQNPTWGLTDEQFAFVTRLLAEPVAEQIETRSAVEAIESMELSPVFQLRFADSAREAALTQAGNDKINELPMQLTGMSRGTALAVILSQYGLGFRTLASQQPGKYVIEVHAGGEDDNLWPVGWKTKEPLISVMPDLFKSIDFELDAVEFDGLVEVIAERIHLKPFYSSWELKAAGIDVGSLQYSRKRDRLSPYRMFQTLGDKFNMGLDVRCDEAGQCFLWVSTANESRAFRQRFAHVIPGRQ
ncbi:MAG: hypothetical protein R3C20_11255 [Planctomycetaceae bacterium]